MILKRWSVPTGEPCNTETVPHGSVGGRGKRSVSYLARGLPNLRYGFQARLTASVRLQRKEEGRQEADSRRRRCGTVLSGASSRSP